MAAPEGVPLLCALDQGTTSTRAIMYEAATLKPVAVHQLEHAQLMPQAGCALRPASPARRSLLQPERPRGARSWVEHDPAEIMERARACLEGAAAQARDACGAITVLGLGITNQRETTVVWCKTTGRALMNAVVWLDTRTRCVRVRGRRGSTLYC